MLKTLKPQILIQALCDGSVDFVVIGGIAAIAHGAAHMTYDLDLCYSRERENCENLARVLAPLKPTLRGAPPDLPFLFDAKTLRSGLNFTFETSLGDVDLLGEVSGLGFYQNVRKHSEEIKIYERRVWILTLEGV